MGLSRQPQQYWMVVYVAYNVTEAHIVAGRLKSEDIPAMVHQEAGADAMGIRIGSMGEVKVLVNPDDYERALAILETDAEELDALPETTDDVSYRWLDEGEDEEDEEDDV